MRFLAATALSAMCILSSAVTPSQAAFVDLGAVTTGTYGGSTSNPTTGANGIGDGVYYDDVFSFTSASAFSLNVLTDTSIAGTGSIFPSLYALYSGKVNDGIFDPALLTFTPASGPLLTTGTATNNGVFSAGAYYFELAGTVSSPTSLTNIGALSVSAVPIPATLPMFGAALLAMSALGFALKRRSEGALRHLPV